MPPPPTQASPTALPTPDTPCFLCGRGAGDGRLPCVPPPVPACLRRTAGGGVLLAAHAACFRTHQAGRVAKGQAVMQPPVGAGPWLIE
jgi:hypothetical protein